tara:strand:+ start:233 stop:862 length:630 start_codon:yes stop_codon:yes gene_type:complete
MATTNAHASVTAKVNNGGTVVNAGNVASNSSITKVIAVKDLKTGTDYGSKIVADTSGVDAGVTTADSGGTGGLAYFPSAKERNFIVRGAGDSAAKVNNDANSVLQVGSRKPSDGLYTGINFNFKSKNLGTMTFDVLARPDGTKVDPGKALDFSTQGADGDLVVITDGSTAATSSDTGRPSLSIPGELTFMFGADAPERADYKAKNSRES